MRERWAPSYKIFTRRVKTAEDFKHQVICAGVTCESDQGTIPEGKLDFLRGSSSESRFVREKFAPSSDDNKKQA
jgi:hypothetical protein